MDFIPILIIIALVAIFEPGNEEINDYCRNAVAEGEFDSRIECWNEYHQFRDEIPNIAAR